MNIQWYPGHMTKAVRMMEENMKLIDLVIELLDARIPFSSKNPDIDRLAAGKLRMVVLNKSDLAKDSVNEEWLRYYRTKNLPCILYNSKSREGIKRFTESIREVCKQKIERDLKRGIKNRSVKAMIVGIPNVGKSTLINNLAGRNAANAGNKPGVTKGKQWIRVGKELDLLDTPGILWPKFEEESIGLHIGYIGSINDDILPETELAAYFIGEILKIAPKALISRYGDTLEGMEDPEWILEEIARVRKCYKKGDETDPKKAADLILDDFRQGKLGRISLERPEQNRNRGCNE